MKTAIVQYYINPAHYSDPDYNDLLSNQNVLVEISRRSFESYAQKYSIDFHHITEPKLRYRHPTFERFDLWLDPTWWDRYEQILYVDSDVFAMPGAPDIFAQYPDLNTFKICESPSWQNARKELKGLLSGISEQEQKMYGFQTGVFMLTRNSAEQMRSWIAQYPTLDDHDGHIMVWSAVQSQVPVERMDERFNNKRAYFHGRAPVYFFHAQGQKKSTHEQRIKNWLHSQGLH
jgi:hypothetical protein